MNWIDASFSLNIKRNQANKKKTETIPSKKIYFLKIYVHNIKMSQTESMVSDSP